MSDSTPEKPQDADDPKVRVDEDWKSHVEAEKEAYKQIDAENSEAGSTDRPKFPEASFPMLVTTLATQATVALGQTIAPDAEEAQVDFDLAKHLIDTLGILDEKTTGNLTPDESGMLVNVLHQLRMLYVAARGQAKEKPEKKSSIELP